MSYLLVPDQLLHILRMHQKLLHLFIDAFHDHATLRHLVLTAPGNSLLQR